MHSHIHEQAKQVTTLAAKPSIKHFPTTRYQGSKVRLLDWLWSKLGQLDFHTCLDLFSGTSAVSYLFKVHGKQVTTNDKYKFNGNIAKALIENNNTSLNPSLVDELLVRYPDVEYDHFVTRMFDGIFFLTEENQELDVIAQNIHSSLTGYEKNIALYALFQACLSKRPFNLFHRANLYMRTAEVERSFGNKTTWDRTFRELMTHTISAVNKAVFDNGFEHQVMTRDFTEVTGSYDLIYMDPPYLNAKGKGVDYLDYYHFLEGLTEYRQWQSQVTLKYKHRPYRRDTDNPWNDKKRILQAFDDSISLFPQSIIAISYRNNGVPSLDEIISLIQRHGRTLLTLDDRDYQYVLSTRSSKEVLLITEPAKLNH